MSSPTLRIVFGDQLTPDLTALDDHAGGDAVLMAETVSETTHVPHSKRKLVFFLSAMRHFAEELRSDGIEVVYHTLGDAPDDHTAAVREALRSRSFSRIVVTQPGDYRVLQMVRGWEAEFGVPIEIRTDSRFIADLDGFREWADGRKLLRLEDFYRVMRRKTGILMNGSEPEGGRWNFDAENRKRAPKGHSFGEPAAFGPDARTAEVIELVETRLSDHPGTTENFDLAVTRQDAHTALEVFIERHLDHFGDYQDAMVGGEATLHHAMISAYLNVGLLDPLHVARRVEHAYLEGSAPLNCVEGFVRQVIGWREFIRCIYWWKMPEYAQRNALGAEAALPEFYWTGDTDMACLRGALRTILTRAYAHHIERLMVTGLFAQLFGADPYAFHEWHMALYCDAIDWVSLPNTLGMSQFADHGLVGTKPYCASGRYIDRMSDYCKGCRYDPGKAVGSDACPFTTLYWDFLDRHREPFSKNRRMIFQIRNLERKSASELHSIRNQAKQLRESLTNG